MQGNLSLPNFCWLILLDVFSYLFYFVVVLGKLWIGHDRVFTSTRDFAAREPEVLPVVGRGLWIERGKFAS
jgi:hypothetical protein